MIRYSAIFFLLISLFSCENQDEAQKRIRKASLLPEAIGEVSDILIVVDENLWLQGVKVKIENIFQENIKGLFQIEKDFDVANVSTKNFSDLLKKQRHILEIQIDKKLKSGVFEPSVGTAKNQKYIKIIGKNINEINDLLQQNAKDIYAHFDTHRLQTIQSNLSKNRGLDHISKLIEDHNLSIEIAKDFNRINNTKNFVYFSKQGTLNCDKGVSSQCYYQIGFFIHYFPYTNPNQFSTKYLMNKRDSLTEIYLLGPDRAKKTYVEHEKSFPIYTDTIPVLNSFSIRNKSWWNMVNATMGGPFVQYAVYDEKNKRIILVDGFVFAPNLNKRRFIHQINAVAQSLKIF